MAEKLLAAAWMSYAERVLPGSAPPIQYQETKRAFYGGANALLGAFLNSLEPGDGEPTPEDENVFIGLQAELDEFVAAVTRGDA